eukprot:c42065_g1_i1 orf=1-189(-)
MYMDIYPKSQWHWIDFRWRQKHHPKFLPSPRILFSLSFLLYSPSILLQKDKKSSIKAQSSMLT